MRQAFLFIRRTDTAFARSHRGDAEDAEVCPAPKRTPPRPNAMAFGGVLMTNGRPNEAATAISIGVVGEGMIAVASGINITAVAVLLIRAENVAAAKHRIKRLIDR